MKLFTVVIINGILICVFKEAKAILFTYMVASIVLSSIMLLLHA